MAACTGGTSSYSPCRTVCSRPTAVNSRQSHDPRFSGDPTKYNQTRNIHPPFSQKLQKDKVLFGIPCVLHERRHYSVECVLCSAGHTLPSTYTSLPSEQSTRPFFSFLYKSKRWSKPVGPKESSIPQHTCPLHIGCRSVIIYELDSVLSVIAYLRQCRERLPTSSAHKGQCWQGSKKCTADTRGTRPQPTTQNDEKLYGHATIAINIVNWRRSLTTCKGCNASNKGRTNYHLKGLNLEWWKNCQSQHIHWWRGSS